GLDSLRRRLTHFNLVAGSPTAASSRGPAFRTNEAGADQLIDPRARPFRLRLRQEMMHTHPRVFLSHDYFERTGCFPCRFQLATAILLLATSLMLQSISMSIEGALPR